jgi:hypothetical protein
MVERETQLVVGRDYANAEGVYPQWRGEPTELHEWWVTPAGRAALAPSKKDETRGLACYATWLEARRLALGHWRARPQDQGLVLARLRRRLLHHDADATRLRGRKRARAGAVQIYPESALEPLAKPMPLATVEVIESDADEGEKG